jgi:hypothetical protein
MVFCAKQDSWQLQPYHSWLTKACDSFQPFKGESGKQLEQLWTQVSNACACNGACMCEQPQVVSFPDALNGPCSPVCSASCLSRWLKYYTAIWWTGIK